MARPDPRAKGPWWHSSEITYLNYLILVLKILSLGFLNDVPTVAELINTYAHTGIQYTIHACTLS